MGLAPKLGVLAHLYLNGWPQMALCHFFSHFFSLFPIEACYCGAIADRFHFCTADYRLAQHKPSSSITTGRPTPTSPKRRSDLSNRSQRRSCLSRVERAGRRPRRHDVRVHPFLQPATRSSSWVLGATASHSRSFLVTPGS